MRVFTFTAASAATVLTVLATFPETAYGHGDNASPDVVHACVQKSSNQVRIVGVTGSCTNTEAPVHWGTAGQEGPAGPAGPPGADAPVDHGVAVVYVQRGAGAPAIWARYSTRIGSPVGDTTGGVFRFTCSTANAPCKVSLGAAALSNTPGSVGVYPRVLIQRQSYTSPGPQSYCEYGDGSFSATAPDGLTTVVTQPPTSTPAYTPVLVHIGGSADCGGPVPTSGLISEITVPFGYYDVFSTFTFAKM